MVKARIVYSETETGETNEFDTELAELNCASVAKVLNDYFKKNCEGYYEELVPIKIMELRNYTGMAFAFTVNLSYFGTVTGYGMMYTEFV